MTTKAFLMGLRGVLTAFLEERISGQECVREIDDLMADEFPDGLSERLAERLHYFHDELAFYVEDPVQRAEDQAYYGPEELVHEVEVFTTWLSAEIGGT